MNAIDINGPEPKNAPDNKSGAFASRGASIDADEAACYAAWASTSVGLPLPIGI